MNYLKKRNQAFKHAFDGLFQSFKKEAHMRVHLLAAVMVIALASYVQVSKTEWLILIGCIAMVMVAELVNTAIERMCDLIEPNFNSSIKYIKDIGAAAVLICSLAALVMGSLIFFEPIKNLLGF